MAFKRSAVLEPRVPTFSCRSQHQVDAQSDAIFGASLYEDGDFVCCESILSLHRLTVLSLFCKVHRILADEIIGLGLGVLVHLGLLFFFSLGLCVKVFIFASVVTLKTSMGGQFSKSVGTLAKRTFSVSPSFCHVYSFLWYKAFLNYRLT